MRQTRRQFVCTAAALAALAGLGTSVAIADEKPVVELDGPFVLGFDQDFPPYGYVDPQTGEFTGFDLDLAAKVCEMEGWELVLEPMAWDAKDALLNGGMITCIWNGFTIEGREEDYAFTAAYMENRQVVVVRADAGIADLAGLAGRVVITQADSAALGLLEEGGDQADLGATFADLQTIGEYNTAFMMLETDAVDAVALDYPVAVFQIGDRLDQFTILEEPLNSEHYGVGFALTDQGKALAAIVEADLLALTKDGTVAALCEKYADQGISFEAWCIGKEEAGAYVDGTYEGIGKGIGGNVPVTVVIAGGKIVEVTVGNNAETVGIGSKAIEKLPPAIIEAQGIEGVDAISGATVTSNAIFKGVAAALEAAVPAEAPAGAYIDGVYEGKGKGIGGNVPVTVTVEGGMIVSVEIGDNGETVGIGSKAIEKLPPAIVEAQGIEGVDAISGATVTSQAIFKGVTAALEGAVA